jgi:hypothetical protein
MGLDKELPEVFDPHSPLWRGRLWVRLVLPGGRYRIHIFWRRIGILLLILSLGGWIAGTVTVRLVAWQRGVVGVSYFDIVFPWRWPGYQADLSRHHWKQAQKAHTEGRTREVFPLLHAVLREDPTNLEARRLMAIYYIRAGYFKFAIECLELGLPAAASDLDYLKLIFGVLEAQQDDEHALALCTRFLPAEPTQSLSELYLALQAATAHFHRGRYDQSEALIAQWGLERSVEGQLLLARCDWERGRGPEAIARLEAEESRFAGRDELARELLRFKRESGDGGEWRRQAHLRVLALPDGPGPRVDWIASLLSTREADAEAEIARFLQEFSRDASALVLLAGIAADNADPALAARVREVARAADLPANAFLLAEVQAAINANNPALTLQLARDAATGNAEGNPHFLSALAGLRALALYADGEKERGEIELQVFTNHDGTRAADGVWLARELRRRGADMPAQRLLQAAVNLDPLNQAALTELVRVLADLGRYDEVAIYLPQLMAMRKPSMEVLRELALKLASLPPSSVPALRAKVAASLASFGE